MDLKEVFQILYDTGSRDTPARFSCQLRFGLRPGEFANFGWMFIYNITKTN